LLASFPLSDKGFAFLISQEMEAYFFQDGGEIVFTQSLKEGKE
jgi:hypothetical protein